MILFNQQSVAGGASQTSGSTARIPYLNPIAATSVFVKGAATDVKVTLKCAAYVADTAPDQSEFITLKEYTADGVDSYVSLNGLWINAEVDNTSGSAAIITVVVT